MAKETGFANFTPKQAKDYEKQSKEGKKTSSLKKWGTSYA